MTEETPATTTEQPTTPAVEQGEAKTEAVTEAKVPQGQLLFEEEKKTEEPTKTEEDAKEGEEKKEDAPVFDVAALKLPDDFVIPEAMKADVEGIAKELNLSTDQMQKLSDLHIKMLQKQNDGFEDLKQSWRAEVEADKDLGGQHLEQTKKLCNDTIRQFALDPAFGGSEKLMDGLKSDLIGLGLGNKISFLRFLTNIAKATRNDSVGGQSGHGAGEETTAKILYPHLK